MALLDRLLGGLTNVSGSLLLGTKGQTGGAGEALGGLLSGFAQARWTGLFAQPCADAGNAGA